MTQTARTLADVLQGEHREIDDGINAFVAGSDERATESLCRAVAALRRHIYVEEERVFPALREQGLFAPVLVMLREHGQLWDALDRIEGLLARAATTWPTGATSCW
jgi:regulator of cell morphogenesis and NO signaling